MVNTQIPWLAIVMQYTRNREMLKCTHFQ